MHLSQTIVDRYFRLGAFIKAFDGLLEIIGGFVLVFFSPAGVHALVAQLTIHETSEDPNDFIASSVKRLDHSLTPGSEVIVVAYLLAHGLVKFILGYALITRKYHYFPAVIAGLLLFLIYEVYLIGLNHSIVLTLFALFDVAIIWLTYLEYQRHRG